MLTIGRGGGVAEDGGVVARSRAGAEEVADGGDRRHDKREGGVSRPGERWREACVGVGERRREACVGGGREDGD